MAELLPCPFCGGETVVYREVYGAVPNGKAFYCQCDKCFAQSAFGGTKKSARGKWNRRADNG